MSALDNALTRAGMATTAIASVATRPHARYLPKLSELEPIFKLLRSFTGRAPYGVMPELARRTGVELRTLEDWRASIRKNPDYVLYGDRRFCHRVFTDQQESYMADFLRRNFVRKMKYCPPIIVNLLAKRYKLILLQGGKELTNADGAEIAGLADETEARELMEARHRPEEAEVGDQDERADGANQSDSEDDWDEDAVPNNGVNDDVPKEKGSKRPGFWASNSWRKGFLKRTRLSLRQLHPKRRSTPDDGAIARFLQTIATVFEDYAPECIFNMDETSWKFLTHGSLTVADTGSEGVQCHFSADAKDCLTAIATISAAGDRLPLWVIAKGKTYRSEQKYRRLAISRDIHLTHSVNGWTNAIVAEQYLRYLRARMGRKHIVLIWDVFSAHREKNIVALAERLRIKLVFIPAGQTDRYQPLDRRVFGPMKERAKEEFAMLFVKDFNADPKMAEALVIMVNVWKRFQQDELLEAWDHLTQW
jgi:hypothetical protein